MDQEIMELLQDNARLTPDQIATMLDIDVELVREKIKGYERDKKIVKYGATVDWCRAECDMVSAVIEVKVTPQRGVGFDEVARRIYNYPEVKSLYLMSGTYDLLVEVAGKSLQDIASFVSAKLSTIEFVASTMTNFILKKYKEDNAILEQEEEVERLKVTP